MSLADRPKNKTGRCNCSERKYEKGELSDVHSQTIYRDLYCQDDSKFISCFQVAVYKHDRDSNIKNIKHKSLRSVAVRGD